MDLHLPSTSSMTNAFYEYSLVSILFHVSFSAVCAVDFCILLLVVFLCLIHSGNAHKKLNFVFC